MKFLLTTLCVAVVSFSATAQSRESKRLLYERKTFPLSAIKDLQLETSGGSISAEGTTNGEAILEVYVTANNNKSISKEEASSRIAKSYQYQTGINGNTLFATAKYKGRWSSNSETVAISYKVIVPVETSSSLETSGGSILISNLKGTEKIATSGGSLSFQKIEGNVKGETSGGSISLQNCKGKLKVMTSGGSIHIDNLTGDIKAATSGGSISVNQVIGSISVETSGGSIILKNISGTTKASTSGGSIIGSFNDAGKGIELSTSAGNIMVQIPSAKGYDLNLEGDRVNVINASVSGSVEKGRVKGTINGGGIPIKAETSSGNINVTLK